VNDELDYDNFPAGGIFSLCVVGLGTNGEATTQDVIGEDWPSARAFTGRVEPSAAAQRVRIPRQPVREQGSPVSVSLGHASLVQQLDGRYELRRAALAPLRDQIGETVFLASWGNYGLPL
jgi:hypothetical protein